VVERVAVAFLGLMCVTALLGVADRFLLELGLPWPEELSRFLLIWTSLLAAAVAAKQRRHFQVTLLLDRLGRLGEVLMDLLGLAVLTVVLAYGLKLVWVFNAQRSPALGIPMSWVYAAVPVSAMLMGYYLIRDLGGRRRESSPTREV
jgi:TRAP-type C4-dicarboxylate transport system permease small subunit